MFHFAATALLAFAFAMIQDLRGADATAISADLYFPQFCVGCTSWTDDTIKLDLDRSINIGKTTHRVALAKYYDETFLEDFGENLWPEAEVIESINVQLGFKPSDLQLSEISVEYRDENQENIGCTYLDSKLRDPSRVYEECGNDKPGSDDLESYGVLTITTVSVISFAVLASVWLLLRFFHNWHLHNMIQRDKTTANLQPRKGR